MDLTAFWETMALLNWAEAGDDDEVLLPVIEKLAGMSDDEIFAFDDMMAKLMSEVDGRDWAEAMYDEPEQFFGD